MGCSIQIARIGWAGGRCPGSMGADGCTLLLLLLTVWRLPTPWSMVMVLNGPTPFHGVPRGILKLEIFYFFVEPRHFSVRHR